MISSKGAVLRYTLVLAPVEPSTKRQQQQHFKHLIKHMSSPMVDSTEPGWREAVFMFLRFFAWNKLFNPTENMTLNNFELAYMLKEP